MNRISYVKRTAFSVERIVKEKRKEENQNKFVSHIALGFSFVITNAGSVAIPLLMRLLTLLSHGAGLFHSSNDKKPIYNTQYKKSFELLIMVLRFSF